MFRGISFFPLLLKEPLIVLPAFELVIMVASIELPIL